MTDESDTPPWPETTVSPPSPSIESDDETESDESDDSPQTIADLSYEHREARDKITEVVKNTETGRILIHLLVDYGGSGITYDMVLDYVDVSRRTVRRNVYDLRDAGIVEVTDTGIALVGFVEDDYRPLAADVLNDFYRDNLS